MGPSGTDGHPPPGPGAERFPVLLRRGLQQECDGGLRRTGNDRGGLRLLPLWNSHPHRKTRPTRTVVQRDERLRIGLGLLQLPLLPSRRWKVDQSRSNR